MMRLGSIFTHPVSSLSTKGGVEPLIDVLEGKGAGELDLDFGGQFLDSCPDL